MSNDMFRGKDLRNKTWLHGNLVTCEDDSGVKHAYIVNGFFLNDSVLMTHHEIDMSTICASPGITDSDNNMVFNNDIIAVKYERENDDMSGYSLATDYFIVTFSDKELKWQLKDINPNSSQTAAAYPRFQVPLCDFLKDDFKVVGNIYDNPDLLLLSP